MRGRPVDGGRSDSKPVLCVARDGVVGSRPDCVNTYQGRRMGICKVVPCRSCFSSSDLNLNLVIELLALPTTHSGIVQRSSKDLLITLAKSS